MAQGLASLGGQALPNGVMIRTPTRWAVAVRKRDGSVHREVHQVVDATEHRGLFAVVAALRIGAAALRVATRVATGLEPTTGQLAVTFGSAAVAAVAILVVAPGAFSGRAAEPFVRAAVLVVYLAIVRRSAGAILALHGAEHKVIAAYESQRSTPTLQAARAESPIHLRCGTSFITLVVILSDVLYLFVPRGPSSLGVVTRIVLFPAVLALSYELLRALARAPSSLWARAVSWPGRMLQHLTTREPNGEQLVLALAALEQVLD